MVNTRAFGVTSLAVSLVSVGAIGFASYSMLPKRPLTAQPPARATPQTGVSARAWAGVLGLDAESLNAAGVTPAQARQVMADLQQYFDASGSQLLQAVERYNTAKKQAADDDRALRAGKEPDALGAVARRQALAAAQLERSTYVNGAFAAATARLSTQLTQKLSTIEANRSRGVPAAYRLTSRTDAQWVELREALSAEQQAAQRGQAAPAQIRKLLADVRAEPDTATALQAHASGLQSIKDAIAQ